MAIRTRDRKLLAQVEATLAAVLDVRRETIELRESQVAGADLTIAAAQQTFAMAFLGAATVGLVAMHAEQVAQAAKKLRRGSIPLLVVPFMSEAGQRACAEARVSWFDLSGNAHIVASGFRVIVAGHPNLFRRPGRPASIFAPKSARVVRWFLIHPDHAFTQREISRATEMSEGFVSRIVARLEADRYLTRVDTDSAGAGEGDGSGGSHAGRAPVRLRDAGLLLDAWKEEYQFSKHTLLQGHVAARSGEALARFVSDTLVKEKVEHAATGLVAAWQMTHFAAFRTATFFVADLPSPELERKLSFREDARGANLWLVVPNDAGVFQGAKDQDAMRCVHPVQAYLDLSGHPERATEAAQKLRSELIERKRDV